MQTSHPSQQPLPLDVWWARVQSLSVVGPPGPVGKGNCLLWRGSINPRNKYGQVRIPPELATLLGLRCRVTQVHRAVWVYNTRKPLARAEPIDHLCGVRACRNFDHLQAVSQLVNNQRATLTREEGLHGWDRFDSDDPDDGTPIL